MKKKEEEEEEVVVVFILKLRSSLRFSPQSQPCQKVESQKKTKKQTVVQEHDRNTRPQLGRGPPGGALKKTNKKKNK
jgi:hypothetical protein